MHDSGDTVSVALVGYGSRGSGAIAQIRNTRGNTRLVAVADVNAKKAKDRVDGYEAIQRLGGCAGDRIFGGIDGYKHAIDSGADLVVMYTLQLQAAAVRVRRESGQARLREAMASMLRCAPCAGRYARGKKIPDRYRPTTPPRGALYQRH